MKKFNYVACDSNHDTNEVCRRCNNTKEVIDPKEILCNLCGECMCPLGTMNEQIPHGLYNAQVQGGYDSYHLADCSEYEFSFCEKCLRDLFTKCKIPPIMHNYLSTMKPELNYLEELINYEHKIWKDSGGHHQAYLNGKCNSVKDCPNDAIYTMMYDVDTFSEDSLCEEHSVIRLRSRNSKLTKFISNELKIFL